MRSLARDKLLYALAYLVALAVAAGAVWLVPIASPWWRAIAGGVAATLTLFCFSWRYDNSAFYDVYWSVAPWLLGAYWLAQGTAISQPRALLALAMTAAWGLRLTFNWWTHWHGLGREDWRYADLRQKTGKGYWVASFFALHLYPLTVVTLGSRPVYVATAAGVRPLNWLDGVAALVLAVAVVVEAVADVQLHRFVRDNRDPQRFLQTGLWRLSRHPNYFGEALAWWGMWLFALAADPGAWWTGAGALAVTGMITLISIPMADKRQAAKRPGFADYMRRTSPFIPWPPRRDSE